MLLESDSPKDEAKPFRMARDVYKSCMDKDQIEMMGVRPLKDILKQFGGWPVLEGDSWNDEGYIWYEQVMTLDLNKPFFIKALVKNLR